MELQEELPPAGHGRMSGSQGAEADTATALYCELQLLRDDVAGDTACNAILVGPHGDLARAKLDLLRRVRPQCITTAEDLSCWVLLVGGINYIVYFVSPDTGVGVRAAFTLTEAIPDGRGYWCGDEKVLASRVAIDVVARLLRCAACGALQ